MGGRLNAALAQFNNGLVSPEIEARTDLQVSAYSCRQLKNGYPRVAGGLFNRGGSVYVPKRDSAASISYLGDWELNNDIPVKGYNMEAHKWTTYGNGICLQTNSQTEYYTSTDMHTWTTHASPDGERVVRVDFLNNEFFIQSRLGTLYKSSDCETWTAVTLPFTTPTGYFNYLAYSNGTYVATAYGIQGVYYSTDLVNWSSGTITKQDPSSTYLDLNSTYTLTIAGVCNGKFIGSIAQQYYTGSYNVRIWSLHIVYSNDGINWVAVHVPCPVDSSVSSSFSVYSVKLNSVAYGNNKYVATVYFQVNTGTTYGQYYVAVSNDLTSWDTNTIIGGKNMLTNYYTKAQAVYFFYDRFYLHVYYYDGTSNTSRTTYTAPLGVDWKEYTEISCAVSFCEGDLLGATNGSNTSWTRKYYTDSHNINSTKSGLIPFVVNRRIAYVLEFGHEYIRFYRNHAQLTDVDSYPIAILSPYQLEDLFDSEGVFQLRYVQKADVMYLFHPKYAMRKLTRTGVDTFSLSEVTFQKGPWEEENKTDITMYASAVDGSVTVTASANFFTEDMVGRNIRIFAQNKYTRYWVAGGSITSGVEYKSDGKFYSTTATSGTMGSVQPTHTEGTAYDGSVTWTYLHSGYGTGKIMAVTSSTTATVAISERLPSAAVSSTNASTRWQLSLADNPVCGCFYKERLCLGINEASGPVAVFSQTGDYENFDDLSFGEQLADCGMKLPILSDLSEIQWMNAIDSLYVGTEGGVTEIKPQTSSQVFGPENITYDSATNIGSCAMQAIRVGGSMLYAASNAKSVYDLMYVNENQAYQPQEVSILASRHLDKGLRGWTLQFHPNRTVWGITKDGKLMGLTYNSAEQVRAFHIHETQGEFISVAVIPSPDGQTDELWAVVKRLLNGESVYCIEYFREGLPVDTPVGYTEEQVRDYYLKYGYFVDCGVQRSFDEPTDTITDLDWLEGKEVAILADGVPLETQTVEDGQITLQTPASVVTVGLPYETIFEPLPVHVDAQNGSGSARVQRINKMVVRLLNSGGFQYGDGTKMDYADLRKTNETGAAISLKSGDVKLNWPGNNTTNDIFDNEMPNATGARMVFKQTKPLPLRILGIFPQLEVTND